MVMGVCRRVLGNHEAAEDAFQATFLVLARKAGSIVRREQLANWLYGVALRAAREARGRTLRQKSREKRYSAMLPAEMPDPSILSEIRAVLDDELARLPERYRAAIVLCELEGLSRRQAAVKLGITEGTLSSRLARAKIQLRDRLTRRGLALSSVALGSVFAREAATAVVRPALVESTIQLATLLSSGSSLAGIVSIPVATLTEGVLKAMLFAKVKSALLGITTVAVLTTGVGVLAQQSGPGQSADDRLKAVEHKLDRLLEALGGSSRQSATPTGSTPTLAQPVPPQPPSAPPPQSASSASLPTPAAAPSAPTPSAPVPPPPPASPNPVVAAAAPRTQPRESADAARSLGQRQSLAGRVQSLEQRLADFERRLAAIERRLKEKPDETAVSELTPLSRDSVLPPLTPQPPDAGSTPVPGSPPAEVAEASPSSTSTDSAHSVGVTSPSAPRPAQNSTQPPSPPTGEPPSEGPR